MKHQSSSSCSGSTPKATCFVRCTYVRIQLPMKEYSSPFKLSALPADLHSIKQLQRLPDLAEANETGFQPCILRQPLPHQLP